MLLRTFFMSLLALMVVAASSASQDGQIYVVHMDPIKVAELDRSLQGVKRWYEAVMDSIIEYSSQEEDKGSEDGEMQSPQLLYVYETVLSGFSAKLSTKQFKFLQNVDGFLFATPDEVLNLHTTYSPLFLGLHAGKGLWGIPNSASDVIVGVIDTGIWPEHVSFRDGKVGPVPSHWRGICEEGTRFSTANCNKKLIGARAFFKGYESAAGRINETVDFRSPRDTQGHGTHTASTAAGNLVPGASMLGVAGGVAGGMSFASRIAAYKVCWPSGCSSADIYAAIDQAVADGVDVLSLSLGGGSRPYYMDNMAIAAFGAVQKGVFVSVSAGNAGPQESTVSNTAPWLMTGAASYLDRSFLSTVKFGDRRSFRGASLYSGKPTKQLSLVYGDSAGGEGAQYCIRGSLSPKLVKGKIVACDRGMNGRTDKGEQVKLAGGAAMLLLNTEAQGEEYFADAHVLPASSLGAMAAKATRDYVTGTKKPYAKIVFEGAVYGSPAPTMAAFSSRGPSSVGPEVIKPDVTAPGVNILAAWPPTVSPTEIATDKRRVSFNLVSGTSMSCPHVSGLAALIKSVHRDWSPAAIKSALMTTAYTLNNRKAPMGDAGTNSAGSATPFAFGSGHVDPERASDPGLIYDITTEDYSNYFCSLNYSSSQREILVGRNYDCPEQGPAQVGDLNYPSFSVIFEGLRNTTAVTYTRTVTNVGMPGRYSVGVSEPEGVSVTVVPNVMAFTKNGEKMSYKVKFVALARRTRSGSSFGELVWVSGRYSVRSPIAVSWK
ncbi:subtilisin-like protease SBT1.1 [Aristolochia californica]|uniref:subtilisin-like protease SBT1.1 n=1 Tax=Aristolochia californica TaxID=171875 RepID=UPI0035D7E7F7